MGWDGAWTRGGGGLDRANLTHLLHATQENPKNRRVPDSEYCNKCMRICA